MQDILAGSQKGLEILRKFRHVDLRGFGIRAVRHRLIKLLKGHTLAKIVQIFFPVQFIVETGVEDTAFRELFRRKIGSGAAAQNIFLHIKVCLSRNLRIKFTFKCNIH